MKFIRSFRTPSFVLGRKTMLKIRLKVWMSATGNTDRWMEALAGQYFLVAESDREIAGFASLKDGAYIDFLYVHGSHLRKGVARYLWSACSVDPYS